jgi:hypothetical protein
VDKGAVDVELDLVFVPMPWQILPIAVSSGTRSVCVSEAIVVVVVVVAVVDMLRFVGRGRRSKQDGPYTQVRHVSTS